MTRKDIQIEVSAHIVKDGVIDTEKLSELGYIETTSDSPYTPIAELGQYEKKWYQKGDFKVEFNESRLNGKSVWSLWDIIHYTPPKLQQ